MVVIKLTCSLFFVLCFASQAFSQEIYLQKGFSIDTAFTKASKIYNVNFAYNPSTIDRNYIIHHDLTISSPNELLETILSDTYDWKYVGNTIVISLTKNKLVTTSSNHKTSEVQLPEIIPNTPPSQIKNSTQSILKEVSGITSLTNILHPPTKVIISAIKPTPIKGKEESISRRRGGTWKSQPFLSAFNYNRNTETGTRSSINGTGGGISVSVHKRKWHLSMSMAYYQVLRNSPLVRQDSLLETDSTLMMTDTTAISSPISVTVTNINSFIKYNTGIGYNIYVSRSLVIPLEFGVSIMQFLKVTGSYNKILYNGYLAIPIALNHKKKSFVIKPFVEVGINNDFKEVEFKSKRRLIGLNIGVRF